MATKTAMEKAAIQEESQELVTVIVASDKENPNDTLVVGYLNGERFEVVRDEKCTLTPSQYELLKNCGRYQMYRV